MLILRTAFSCISSPLKLGERTTKRPIERALAFLLIGLVLGGCGVNRYQSFQGETMGTYYRVVGNCSSSLSQEALEVELQMLNSILSTYDSESEISAFNRSNVVGSWIETHEILIDVIAVALEVSRKTNGVFDVTIAPLVELWGFGPEEVLEPPHPDSIARALELVNYQLLEIDEDRQAMRKLAGTKLDLSGIGKGYGVDHLSNMLIEHECSDFLVDIGGEIRVRGRNESMKPWRVGMEVPDGSGHIKGTLGLSTGAIATSGTYRNFRIYGDTTYSHLIDPRTGYPTSHNLRAVSVYHVSAATADALATALFIMGFDEALTFAESHGIAVALTIWDADAEKMIWNYSSNMADLLKKWN